MSLGTVGLINLGNSCYMNAVIQCLSNTQYFKENILNIDIFSILICDNISSNIIDINNNTDIIKKSFAYQLIRLFNGLWDITKTGSAVRPITFRTLFGEKIRNFSSMAQQDSQEALLCILDTINEELGKKVITNLINISEQETIMINMMNDMTDLQKYNLANQHNNLLELYTLNKLLNNSINKKHSFVTELFNSIEKSTTICPHCNYKSIIMEQHYMSGLNIPYKNDNDEHFTLKDCLDNTFNKKEELSCGNEWHCIQCNNKVQAIKTTEIYMEPQILILYLKRYNNVSNITSRINNLITFPLEDLQINNSKYDLYAVINQMGSLNGGHYNAFIKNNEWFLFDDETVLKINEEMIITRNAYILFYKKK